MIFAKVPCSLMDDNTHSHCHSAGFKGALSYRTGHGIPGYTGYCPNQDNIPLNIKGSTSRTGKLCDSKTLEELRDATNNTHNKSHYLSKYTAEPDSYNPDNKKGGGYWLFEQKIPEDAPFSGKTTYATELADAKATATEQLNRSLGLSTLTATSEQARYGRAGRNRHTAINSAETATGDVLGYTTTYGAMVAKNPLTGGGAAAGAEWTRRAAAEPRPWRAPRANPPRQTAQARSAIDFGVADSDPMDCMPPTEATMTMRASTRDLADGTQRNTWQIPGYTGFQCATQHNPVAVEHSMGKEPRQDTRVFTALCTLQQYSRSRVPGTTTFKPEDPCNMTVVQPSQGPSTDTTYGFNNSLVANNGAAAGQMDRASKAKEYGINSFFSAGGSESVSDNGRSDAQQYFKLVRPLEGLAKHALPSKTAATGGKFPPGSLGL